MTFDVIGALRVDIFTWNRFSLIACLYQTDVFYQNSTRKKDTLHRAQKTKFILTDMCNMAIQAKPCDTKPSFFIQFSSFLQVTRTTIKSDDSLWSHFSVSCKNIPATI